jgi:hypothetical protein
MSYSILLWASGSLFKREELFSLCQFLGLLRRLWTTQATRAKMAV